MKRPMVLLDHVESSNCCVLREGDHDDVMVSMVYCQCNCLFGNSSEREADLGGWIGRERKGREGKGEGRKKRV